MNRSAVASVHRTAAGRSFCGPKVCAANFSRRTAIAAPILGLAASSLPMAPASAMVSRDASHGTLHETTATATAVLAGHMSALRTVSVAALNMHAFVSTQDVSVETDNQGRPRVRYEKGGGLTAGHVDVLTWQQQAPGPLRPTAGATVVQPACMLCCACWHTRAGPMHASTHGHAHAPCIYLTPRTCLRRCALAGWNFWEWQGHRVHYITAGTEVRTKHASTGLISTQDSCTLQDSCTTTCPWLLCAMQLLCNSVVQFSCAIQLNQDGECPPSITCN